jgi:primosomal protein N' (replication factor Y)
MAQARQSSTGAAVAVLLPLPLAGAYDYAVPEGMRLGPGDAVRVPLGRREALGIVWGPATGEVDDDRLRPVSARLEAPPLSGELRALVDFVARYTLNPPGAILRMALSVPEALEPPKARTGYRLAVPSAVRVTPARAKVLALLKDGATRPLGRIATAAGVGAAVVKGLADAGALEIADLPAEKPGPRPHPDRPGPELTPDQAAASEVLRARVRAGAFAPVLLEGVTGSGKTEVYFEAVAECLRRGRQALVLLPEIALTAQWLERFRARFGAGPAEWHSDLGAAERRRTWRTVALGEAPVVVGARSALFLPFPALGLIVVDEEHDTSFKQEEGTIYNARDMAVFRASKAGVPIVLSSATPAVETIANVEAGRYERLALPARYGAARLPDVAAIDLRKDPPPRGRWLAPSLAKALAETVAQGEQALLFLNRRGYAPLTLCRACGHRLKCPNCSSWLVEHKFQDRLQCHHCGHATARPKACPACGAEDKLVACGPGVERVAEEVAALLPQAKVAVVASDTVDRPSKIAALVRGIEDKTIDVLVGTQMLAKGHHFPMLTLVGVVDADLGLDGGDLRAGERSFQLLMQVAGRAGRADRPGRVLIQTHDPQNPAIAAMLAGDREGFVARELAARRAAGMPPYGRLVALIVSAPTEAMAAGGAKALARAAPRQAGVEVFGPAPAPLALLRGRYRQRLLLKTGRDANVQALVDGWLRAVALPSATRVQIDVDPMSFM